MVGGTIEAGEDIRVTGDATIPNPARSTDQPRGFAGARRVTSYDIARAAGVAQSTVSRCFSDNTNIAPETRERVRAIAATLGYVPNALARSLITQRSHMVGVVATRLTNHGNPDVVFAIGEALAAAGRKLLLIGVENNEAVAEALRDALAYPLDGLIAGATIAPADLDRFVAHRVPVVFFNRDVAAMGVDSVRTDHAEAARLIATRLVAAGHRRFACLGGPRGSVVGVERARAFLGRLAELGADDVAHLATDLSYEGGRDAFSRHAETAPAPEAVFCVNDQLAFGVIDACRFGLGLRVPEDVSVVGFDDVPSAARPPYALTTVRQDLGFMARRAVELLLRREAAPAAPGEIAVVPGELVVRGSARLAP